MIQSSSTLPTAAISQGRVSLSMLCGHCKKGNHRRCTIYRKAGHGMKPPCMCRRCDNDRKEAEKVEAAKTSNRLEEIVAILSRYKFRFISETQLQQGISSALTMSCVDHQREVRLDPQSRLDFLCDEGLAIEVKVSGNFCHSTLVRQLHRYAASERVNSILVVANKYIQPLPATMNGKPILYHVILGSML